MYIHGFQTIVDKLLILTELKKCNFFMQKFYTNFKTELRIVRFRDLGQIKDQLFCPVFFKFCSICIEYSRLGNKANILAIIDNG